MKRLLLTLAILLTVSQLTYAQDVSSLINRFKDERGAEYVSIPSFVMSICKLFMDGDKEEKRIAKRVNALQVLSLEDCSKDVRTRFAKASRELNTSGYEMLMQVNEDGEQTTIYLKELKSGLKEFVLRIDEKGDEFTLIVIKGSLTPQEIKDLIDKD